MMPAGCPENDCLGPAANPRPAAKALIQRTLCKAQGLSPRIVPLQCLDVGVFHRIGALIPAEDVLPHSTQDERAAVGSPAPGELVSCSLLRGIEDT